MFNVDEFDIFTKPITYDGEEVFMSGCVEYPHLVDFADTDEEARRLMEESVETFVGYYQA